jgi:hypothetical protein
MLKRTRAVLRLPSPKLTSCMLWSKHFRAAFEAERKCKPTAAGVLAAWDAELSRGGREATDWVGAAAVEKPRFLRDLETCQKEYCDRSPVPPSPHTAAAAAAPAAALTATAAAPDPAAAPAAAPAPAALTAFAAPAPAAAVLPEPGAAEPGDDAEIASATAHFQFHARFDLRRARRY